MAGPLSGFRILDLSAVISGPFGTMILADQGADVIKVEPVGGDFTRAAGNRMNGMSASFLNNNRNKRSIAVDLKAPGGVDLIKRLAKDADVLVQNFRPGVMDRLGLGEDAIREMRPDIVYVLLSGFGEKGPFAGKPVYDPIVQALSGLASVQGGSDQQRPRLLRTILPDKLTAITASQAITAALLARERTGEGQHVRLSMLDAVVAFLWSSDMGGLTFVGKEVSTQRAATFIDLIYETKAGYISISVMSDQQWQALAHTTGHPEWLADERFQTPAGRDQHANERLELIQSALYAKTAEQWLTLLDDAGVPCAPVLNRSEMIQHPQVQATGIVVESDHPRAGRLRQTRNAARFEGTPTTHQRGAPALAEHTHEILQELGYDDETVAELVAQGAVSVEPPS